jgi:hypothetical protein
MQVFFDVLAVLCFVMGLSTVVIMSIGWLTCADYYFKIVKIGDGLPAFLTTIWSVVLLIMIVVGYFIVGDLFIAPLYINMILWIIVILSTLCVVIFEYLAKCRQYFANKRGRRI